MLFALQNDGVLRAYETSEDLSRSIEPLDIEETLRTCFDDEARPRRIEWLRGSRSGRIFGPFRWAENGEYRISVASKPDPEAALQMLGDADLIDPAAAQAVRDFRRRLQILLKLDSN
jgi:hypothetical protein